MLDKFRILFETDAGNANADLDALNKNAEKTAENVDKAGKKVNEATKGTRGLAAGLTEAATAAGGLRSVLIAVAGPLAGLLSVSGLVAGVNAVTDRVAALDAEAKKIGTSATNLDALRKSMTALGGEAETATGLIGKLGDMTQEAFVDRTSTSAKALASLGIKVKESTGGMRDSLAVLLDMSDKLSGRSQMKAMELAAKMGITDLQQIDLLRRGRAAIVAAMDAEKERGVVTENLVRLQREHKRETEDWSRSLEVVGLKIAEVVLPWMTAFYRAMNQLRGWMAQNSDLVTGFFVAVAGAITAIYLPAMARAVVATIAFLAPWLLIIAAMAAVGAAFALAWEDVQFFLRGQPSLLGELVKRYTWVADAVKAIGEAYKWLAGRSADATAAMKSDSLSLGAIWSSQWSQFLRDAKGAFDDVEAAYTWLKNKLAEGGWEAVTQSIIDAFEKAGNAMMAKFDAAVDYMIKSLQRLAAAIANTLTGGVFNFTWGNVTPPGVGTPTPGPQVPTGTGAPPAPVAPPVPIGGAGQKLGFAPPSVSDGQRQFASASRAPLSTGAPGRGAVTEIRQDQRKIDVKGGPVTIHAGMSASEVTSAIDRANRNMIRTAAAAFDDGVKA